MSMLRLVVILILGSLQPYHSIGLNPTVGRVVGRVVGSGLGRAQIRLSARTHEESGERVVSLESDVELMDLAVTSAFKRPEAPRGVVMAVLYFSLFNPVHKEALLSFSELSRRFPRCNFAKVTTRSGQMYTYPPVVRSPGNRHKPI